jgi:glycine/D-amino acid oxidase-like deaminating enzyme
MAAAAERHGAQIHEQTPATAVRRRPAGGFEVTTTRGVVAAGQVMVATDAYSDGGFGWLRKQLICVGSFIIVTEPLGADRALSVTPRRRMVVDTKNVGHYIRLTPDNRLMFGGRARFASPNPASDRKSGTVLRREMTEIFPGSRTSGSTTAGAAASGSATTACRTPACTTSTAAAMACRWPPTWAAAWPR